MIIYYDLEFIGDLKEGAGHCRIYEFAAIDQTGREFQAYVDPGEPYLDPVVGALPPLDKMSEPLASVMERFFAWVGRRSEGVYMVSHGNFRSDQLVLQAQGVLFPPFYYCADSLMITRAMLKGVPRYTLGYIFEFLGHGAIADPHTALHDARALKTILEHLDNWTMYACVYDANDTALSNLNGIGAKTELYLQRSGFNLRDRSTWGCLTTLSEPQRSALEACALEACASFGLQGDT